MKPAEMTFRDIVKDDYGHDTAKLRLRMAREAQQSWKGALRDVQTNFRCTPAFQELLIRLSGELTAKHGKRFSVSAVIVTAVEAYAVLLKADA